MRLQLVSYTTIRDSVGVHGANCESNGRVLSELDIVGVVASAAVPLFALARAHVAQYITFHILDDSTVQALHHFANEGLDAFGTRLQYEASFEPKSALYRVVVRWGCKAIGDGGGGGGGRQA